MSPAKRDLLEALDEVGEIRSLDFRAAFGTAGMRHEVHNELLKVTIRLKKELSLNKVSGQTLDEFESDLLTSSFQNQAINKASLSTQAHQSEIDELLLKIDNVRDEIKKG